VCTFTSDGRTACTRRQQPLGEEPLNVPTNHQQDHDLAQIRINHGHGEPSSRIPTEDMAGVILAGNLSIRTSDHVGNARVSEGQRGPHSCRKVGTLQRNSPRLTRHMFTDPPGVAIYSMVYSQLSKSYTLYNHCCVHAHFRYVSKI
jgi:hypothetical protein